MLPAQEIGAREVIACVGHGVHPDAAIEFIAADYGVTIAEPRFDRERTIEETRRALDSDESWGGRIQAKLRPSRVPS